MLNMLRKTFECSICMEKNRGLPDRICCGQQYCALCLYKTRGHCMVCQKDGLNQPNTCSDCDDTQNFFSIQEWMNTYCLAQVCGKCNNVKLNGPLTFCSTRCNFQALMEMKPIADLIDTVTEEEECRQE